MINVQWKVHFEAMHSTNNRHKTRWQLPSLVPASVQSSMTYVNEQHVSISFPWGKGGNIQMSTLKCPFHLRGRGCNTQQFTCVQMKRICTWPYVHRGIPSTLPWEEGIATCHFLIENFTSHFSRVHPRLSPLRTLMNLWTWLKYFINVFVQWKMYD